MAGAPFQSLRQGAEKRGLAFSLTADQLETWWTATPDICEYCGCTLEEFRRLRDYVLSYKGNNPEIEKFKRIFASSRQAEIDWLTIDRRNNTDGYCVEKMAKACWFCNYMKGSLLSYEDMIVVGRRALQRLRSELEVEETG